MTAALKIPGLTPTQAELLTYVCLKRYDVQRRMNLGSFQSGGVDVRDEADQAGVSYVKQNANGATLAALRKRGLIHYGRPNGGYMPVKPTEAGIKAFLAAREKARA